MDKSDHLRHVMGVPVQEWVEPGSGATTALKSQSEIEDDLNKGSGTNLPPCEFIEEMSSYVVFLYGVCIAQHTL